MLAEVDEQTEFQSGGFQVVEHLSAELVGQVAGAFDLKDDLVEAYKVGSVNGFECAFFESQLKLFLENERHLTVGEFDSRHSW